MFLSVLEALAVTAALSADAFVSAFALSAGKVKISFFHSVIISVICTVFLAASLLAGDLISVCIPTHAAMWTGFFIFLSLGLFKLIKRPSAKDTAAVEPLPKLSLPQSALLAVGLSIDGLAAGLGAGLVSPRYFFVILFSLLTGVAAILSGAFVGRKAAAKIRFSLAWVSGAVLILLAFLKLM